MSKTALITGASKGIGRALAERMLHAGYRVLGTSRTGKIDIAHDRFYPLKLDLVEEDSIAAALQAITDNGGRIDVLVNNAGIGPDLHLDLPERASFSNTFEVNVQGTVFFTESVVHMLPKDGIILNISSKMGSLEVCEKINSVAYRMSKTALNMYTKILANRLQDQLKVACIHPGWVQTTIIESNLTQATLTPKDSANRIFKFMTSEFKHGIYWDCEDNTELPW